MQMTRECEARWIPRYHVQSVWAGLRTSRYKYVEWASGHKVLFDLTLDTYELQNEIDNPAYQPILQGLAGRLEALKGLASSVQTRPRQGRTIFALPLAAWGGTEPYVWTLYREICPRG